MFCVSEWDVFIICELHNSFFQSSFYYKYPHIWNYCILIFITNPFYRCYSSCLKAYILSPDKCFINILGTVLRIHKFAFLNSMKGNVLSSLWYRGNKSKLTCAFVFILVDSRPSTPSKSFRASSLFILFICLTYSLTRRLQSYSSVLSRHSLFTNIYRYKSILLNYIYMKITCNIIPRC